MSIIIYIKLLNEGTVVYRPVYALENGDGKYQILDNNNYNPNDETWEFLPGSIVTCETKLLEKQHHLVATSLSDSQAKNTDG